MPYQLTPEHAKLWLPVVRGLREYYERKNDKFVHRCPLSRLLTVILNVSIAFGQFSKVDGVKTL